MAATLTLQQGLCSFIENKLTNGRFAREFTELKKIKGLVLASLLVMGSLSMTRVLEAQTTQANGAVFALTNSAIGNQVASFTRLGNGALAFDGYFATGGNGSGGTVDPLHSQGALRIAGGNTILFAVNAGSGTISSFSIHGSSLDLVDTVPSGGSAPSAVAEHSNLLYVLNSGGNGNVSGFTFSHSGQMIPIPNSTRNLSNTDTGATSLTFSPNGQFLVVTERATNMIDVFHVLPNGTLSPITVNPSVDAVPFAANFTGNGQLLVSSASNFITSYAVLPNGTLQPITASLPTFGAATCWQVETSNLRTVYTSNAGTSSISGFSIRSNGVLMPLAGTVVGNNLAGSTNLDIAADSTGRFVYTLNTGTGSIGTFAIQPNGDLLDLGAEPGLPVAAGMNGIAAY